MQAREDLIQLDQIYPSLCGTYHTYQNEPLYAKRFMEVLKFHSPGLAPVKDGTGAYHIDLKGNPAYSQRFKRTFGFYHGYAAVECEAGCYHILPDGNPLYETPYDWCGNYQEEACVVRDIKKNYLHINQYGKKLYEESYAYVGDFKDGIAVVCCEDGQYTHIDKQGKYIHGKWFIGLDIFHKGFARAKDQDGWLHIDKNGVPLYKQRFLNIEPFYNGVAYGEDASHRLILMDETGQTVKIIKDRSPYAVLYNLSNDMVGFWKSELIFTAINLNIFNLLPAEISIIEKNSALEQSILRRLLRGLWELGLVYPAQNDEWHLTEKGDLLKNTPNNFMGPAGRMWEQVARRWESLPVLLENYDETPRQSFKLSERDKNLKNEYYKALDGYLLLDVTQIIQASNIKEYDKVVSVGRPSAALMDEILKLHPHLQATLLLEREVSETVSIPSRFNIKTLNYLHPWDLQAEIVLLPKILHCWPDAEAKDILQNAANALTENGTIYLIELLLKEDSPMGSLLDINMFIETNGKLRTLNQWEAIIKSTKLSIHSVTSINGFMYVMKIGKKCT